MPSSTCSGADAPIIDSFPRQGKTFAAATPEIRRGLCVHGEGISIDPLPHVPYFVDGTTVHATAVGWASPTICLALAAATRSPSAPAPLPTRQPLVSLDWSPGVMLALAQACLCSWFGAWLRQRSHGTRLLRKFAYGPGLDEPICLIDVGEWQRGALLPPGWNRKRCCSFGSSNQMWDVPLE